MNNGDKTFGKTIYFRNLLTTLKTVTLPKIVCHQRKYAFVADACIKNCIAEADKALSEKCDEPGFQMVGKHCNYVICF